MSTGQLVDVIVTLLVGAMAGIIGYLLKQRFDTLEVQVTSLQTTANANNVAIGRLIESQQNVVRNQTMQSRSQERLIGEMDDLEDVNNQLQIATDSLRRKLESHEELHARLAADQSDMRHE